MALGYTARRETPPYEAAAIVVKESDRSYLLKLARVVTPMWFPKSQADFHEEGVSDHPDYRGKRAGTVSIQGWLAKKEGLL